MLSGSVTTIENSSLPLLMMPPFSLTVVPPFVAIIEFCVVFKLELIFPLLQILLYKSGVAVVTSSISVRSSVHFNSVRSDGKYDRIR